MEYKGKVWINLAQDIKHIPGCRKSENDPLKDLYFSFPYVESVTSDRKTVGDLLSFGEYCAHTLSTLVPDPKLVTGDGELLLSHIVSKESVGIVASVADFCVVPVEHIKGHGWPIFAGINYAWCRAASVLVPEDLKDAFLDLFTAHEVDFSSGMFIQKMAYILAFRKPVGSPLSPGSFWSMCRSPYPWLDYQGIRAIPSAREAIDQVFPFFITTQDKRSSHEQKES